MQLTDEPSHVETNFTLTAVQFINSTSSHVFLTGKAGTGKTTFLKNLAGRTHKNFIVVAPTGIAALNAGGVTVHSQFLLPFGTFLPDRSINADSYPGGNLYTQNTLARKHPLNSARKQVLRSLDLLIIDEVSMLRADLLDAIDYRMKAARGNFSQSFGGVQLLLIGDLFQLPPVVKREDQSQISRYYNSAWFFEAKALQEEGFVYIELDKIFRQHDQDFIDILNHLRNNSPTLEDINKLNDFYRPDEEIRQLGEVVTLTTHNYKADDINQRRLRDLKSASHFFEAKIDGDFPDSMFPVLQKLELKVGAQIMFIKNDNDGKEYYNGKLATVSEIANGEISALLEGSQTSYTLKREKWENKKYAVNETTRNLDEEVVGSFEQFPVKLAWAITVHKSQGLTFDKAIIDVGQAFADGQVYVALSRLRSLNGLVLRTRIDPRVISTDKQVVAFSQSRNEPDQLPVLLKARQAEYLRLLMMQTFDFATLIKEIAYIQKEKTPEKEFEEETMKSSLTMISESLHAEKENTVRFRTQLLELLDTANFDRLVERIKKGTIYYNALLQQNQKLLLQHMGETRQKKRVKKYFNHLSDLDQLLSKKMEEVERAVFLTESILRGETSFDFSGVAKRINESRMQVIEEVQKFVPNVVGTRKRKKRKKEDSDLSTYDITLNMLEKGMTIEEIAKERGLVPGTIEGHLAKAVGVGRLSIFKFMQEETVILIAATLKDLPEGFSSKDLFVKLNGKYSYGQLRAVMQHLKGLGA